MDFKKPAFNSNTITGNGFTFTLHDPGPIVYPFPLYPFPLSPLRSSSSQQFTFRSMSINVQHRAQRGLTGPRGAAMIEIIITNQHRMTTGMDYVEYNGYLLLSLRQRWDQPQPQHLGIFCKQIHNSKGKKKQNLLDNLFTTNNSSSSNSNT